MMDSDADSHDDPAETPNQHGAGRRQPSRKQQRKMDRNLKKVKRLAWYTHKKVEEILPDKRRSGLNNPTGKRKERTEEDDNAKAAKKLRLQQKEEEKAQKRIEELKERNKQKRIKRLEEENEAESRLIKKLEKQLHLNKRKNKTTVPASFAHDGLDYLLEVLENPKSEMGEEGEEVEDPMDESSHPDDITVGKDLGGEDDDNLDSLDEDFGDSEEDEEAMEDQPDDFGSSNDEGDDSSLPAAEFREDIYGRLRDSAGNVVKPESTEKYIPPARKAAVGGSEAQIQLQRQLKGLLNRLTETNMAGIVSKVDQLFASNSRHDMNETLTNMVFIGCITGSLMPKRFALEHGMFMALLFQKLGVETGAFYVQRLLKQYDDLVSNKAVSEKDKRLDNVVLLWCHAYNFKILHASMIFDLLGEFSSRFTEKDIDMILLVLREVGFSLRKDDPAALKDLIANIQTKTTEKRLTGPQIGSRVAFMMDVVTAIKNNNMKKIPNYDPSELEHLLKVYRSLIHKGHVIETPLKISLTDLRMAGERGKWWVVGAAWNKPELTQLSLAEEPEKASSLTASLNVRLLDLAIQQRMNTDVRKAIFCAVMGSEDYNEAFECIMKLNLKSAQQAEIFHVLVHCGLNEKRFNPFYSFVLEKFCASHRSYQRQLLFVLWDKIRDLPALSLVQLKNLARIVAHGVINNHALPITALKKINFAEMNPAMVKFLRMVLASLLLTPSDEATKDIFSPLAEKKYRTFRESLRLFLRHFMTRNSAKILKGDFAKFSQSFLKARIDVAEKSLVGGYSL